MAFLRTAPERGLGCLDLARLLALLAIDDVKRHLLAFFQGFEASHADFGEMGEEVFTAAVRGDEAEAFGIIEPLNGTSCHVAFLSLSLEKLRDHPASCLNLKALKNEHLKMQAL